MPDDTLHRKHPSFVAVQASGKLRKLWHTMQTGGIATTFLIAHHTPLIIPTSKPVELVQQVPFPLCPASLPLMTKAHWHRQQRFNGSAEGQGKNEGFLIQDRANGIGLSYDCER